MGNKLARRRHAVDDRYTRPQGLYQHKDVDHKKLRKLILDSKLAPCYPGDEECNVDLEECPICFLYYPSLNRSQCCMKGICTECFLQMKAPNSTRPTQCPFCKTANYAVEYRGVRSKEEKGIEQIEEQRVIEAKIRMRQQELLDEEERMQKRQEVSSSMIMTHDHVECSSIAVPSFSSHAEGEEISCSQELCATPLSRQLLLSRQNRDDEFDLDLEDIMVMEAIWLSIQENGRQRNPGVGEAALAEQYAIEDCVGSSAQVQLAESSSSPSGGLACAIAALAERQQMDGESSACDNNGSLSTFGIHPGCGGVVNRDERVSDNYHQINEDSTATSPSNQLTVTRDDNNDWRMCCRSEASQAGTSYASFSATEDTNDASALPPAELNSFSSGTGPIIPESFDEQMMLAMAVSLTEARARASGQGVAWH